MSNADQPPGPPGPPGPPPAPGPAAPQDVSRYETYLKAKGAPTDDIHEDESLRVGDWRFYYRGPAIRRSQQVALDGSGNAVAVKQMDHWRTLLATPELDAAGANKRIVWLYGSGGAVDAKHPFKDPAVAALVKDATLDRTGDTIVFTGWHISPPQMQTPYRVVVTAPKSGPAAIEIKAWDAIK